MVSRTLRALAAARRTGGDGRLAALTGAAAFFVYWLTLFPGVTAVGDSPKFQYVGRLLGTAHQPGYPLYVLLTWAFSYVPVGSVAYRANLFSAVAASLAVAFLFLALRRLRCPRPIAAAAALACAFGHTFWSQAVRAEVYGLASLLLAAFLLALFRWSETRRWPDLLLAIAVASLALGNHLTITLIAPAAVVYAIWIDRRQALRPATLLAGSGLVVLGLAQYLYILVRTHQHARFLEAKADSLRQLANVVRGSQFESLFFGVGLHEVVGTRLPLVARLLLEELNPAGAALLVVALVVMALRRVREAVFFLIAAAAVAFFALTYKVPDTEVFLIPGFVLGWVVIGWGVGTLLPVQRRARLAVVALAWLILPGANLVLNYRANDGHARRGEAEFFRNFFPQLPSRVAIPRDLNYITWLLTYEIDVEHAGRGRDVRLIAGDVATVRRYAAWGYEVYAFGAARNELQEQGLHFVPLVMGRRPDVRGTMSEWPVYRLEAVTGCSAVTGEISDLADLARRSQGTLLLRLRGQADDADIEIRATGANQPVLARMRSARAALAPHGDTLHLRLRRQEPPPIEGPQEAWRPSVLMGFGAAPSSLFMRSVSPGQEIEACPDPLLGRELARAGNAPSLGAAANDDVFFGDGWRPGGEDGARVAEGGTTGFAVPLAAPARLRLSIIAAGPARPAGGEREAQAGSISLTVNDRAQGAREVRGDVPLAWDVEASAWRAGLNDVRLAWSPAGNRAKPLLFVQAIRLEAR